MEVLPNICFEIDICQFEFVGLHRVERSQHGVETPRSICYDAMKGIVVVTPGGILARRGKKLGIGNCIQYMPALSTSGLCGG